MNRTSRRTAAWSRSSISAVVEAPSMSPPLGLSCIGSSRSLCHAPGCSTSAGALSVCGLSLALFGESNSPTLLLASDDLADPRVVQVDLLADLAQGQAFLLSLSERFAPCLVGRVGFALELPLSGADCLASFGLLLRHRRDPIARHKM